MTRRITAIIILMVCIVSTMHAQLYLDNSVRSHKQYADSIRKAFDNGPYFSLYRDNYFIAGIPLGQEIKRTNSDVKFQVSIAQRLTKSVLPFNTYLFLTYTQKCFWNVFEESLPMHDLNFNPGIGLSKLLIVKGHMIGKATLLIEHESNGRDGDASRSWNRITLGANVYITPQMMVHGKMWIPIIDGENNKDLLDYRGVYESGLQIRSSNNRWGFALVTAKRKGWNFNFNFNVEINYRLFHDENQYFFIQYYNGYAENLLDYKEHHSRIRAGLVIKPNFFSEY
ncbi:MAG: phospholipase A [Muribaculaceae bacterium]